jgi:hypothetical protein
LETTISEVADGILNGEISFAEGDMLANNEGNAADACKSCNSQKGTKKVGEGFNAKKLSKRLEAKLGTRIKTKQ